MTKTHEATSVTPHRRAIRMMRMRVTVVGGGIVGLATAFRLQQRLPDARVTILEKERAVALHQSSHNSGVLHCGLYYKPGSRRARLAVRGIRQMVEFCQTHGIPHDVCGKVVVAATEDEVPRLHALFERGCQNGLTGLRMLSRERAARDRAACGRRRRRFTFPQEGIADYPAVCETLAALVREQGGEIVTGARVTALHRDSGGWRAIHTAGETSCDFLVTCAGLYSDRVAELAGRKREVRIVPFRGEYYLIRPERQFLVRNLIYPVADPRFPFLGVHFTRRIHGRHRSRTERGAGVRARRLHQARRESRRSGRRARLSRAVAISREIRPTCWDEIRRSFSRELFCRSLQRLVPEIQPDDLIPGGSGVRAQAMSPEGSLVDDFHFVQGERELHVVNAPSPAATSSLAIGEEIAEMVSSIQY